MGTIYNEISDRYKKFIEEQKMFFVGTAGPESRVNISPKGMDTFRIIDKNRVAWLSVTGSGNETAAHVDENPRMTIMFVAFTDSPTIIRLYGTAKAIYRTDPDWNTLIKLFPSLPGARQIYDINIDMVQKSCGMAVPFYDYIGERDQLKNWAKKQGDSGVKKYWKEKNQISLDGKPTNILAKNT